MSYTGLLKDKSGLSKWFSTIQVFRPIIQDYKICSFDKSGFFDRYTLIMIDNPCLSTGNPWLLRDKPGLLNDQPKLLSDKPEFLSFAHSACHSGREDCIFSTTQFGSWYLEVRYCKSFISTTSTTLLILCTVIEKILSDIIDNRRNYACNNIHAHSLLF